MAAITNSTQAFYRRSLGQIGDLRAEAEKLQTQISSGERLQRSSDDPVASARLRALSRMDRLARIDVANARSAAQDTAIGADGVQDIADLFTRGRELAVRASSETTDPDERIAIAQELEELRSSIFAVANRKTDDGRALFGGEASREAYRMDAGTGAVTYAGTPGSGTIAIGEGVTVDRGLTGPEFLEFQSGGGPVEMFAFLETLARSLRNAPDSAVAAQAALAGFEDGMESLGKAQTVLGARLAWIEQVQDTNTSRTEMRAEESGDIGGTELTSAIATLQQTLTVLEASQASFARLADLSLFKLIR